MDAVPEKVRVLCVTASLGGGGAEMHLMRVLNGLDRSQFVPAVAVTRGGGSYEAMLAPDVALFALGHAGLSSSASIGLAIPRLRALLKTYRPDVVCSVMDQVNLATLLAVASLSDRPPLVLVIQINPAPAYDGRLDPLSVAIRFAIRQLYHRADRVISLSHGVARELISRDPRLEAMIEIIPNAATDDIVDRAVMKPMPREGVASNERLIVACGRLVPQKGFPDLLDAIALLRKELPVKLWILGDGPEHERLRRRAEALGIVEHVKFLGFQTEPWRYMATADVFALSSIYEGFGNVVVEAMASGIPVVSTDCPYGPAEVITEGVNGLLVPTGDVHAMKNALLRVLRDPVFAATLATNGRERAKAYRGSTIAEGYGEVLRQVARRPPSLNGSASRRPSVPPASQPPGVDGQHALEIDVRRAKAKSFFDQGDVYLRKDAAIDLRARLVRSLIGPVDGLRVLDVGCGDGRVSLQLLPEASHITLLDLSDKMLARASERVPPSMRDRISLVQGAAQDFRTEHPFDLVLCIGVFAHVSDSDALWRALSAVVRQGGRCIVQISDFDATVGRVVAGLSEVRRWTSDPRGYSPNVTRYSESLRVAAEHGFDLTDEGRYWRFPPGMGVLPDRWTRHVLEWTQTNARLQRMAPERVMVFQRR